MKHKIKIYEPTAPQLKALDVLYNQKPKILLLNWGRQVGKSWMSLADGLYDGMNNDKHKTLFVSPTYNNNIKRMKNIESMFDGHEEHKENIFESIKWKEQTYAFNNTNSILEFASSEQGDTLRGDTVNTLRIDEAAFMSKSFITEVLLPMIMRTDGNVVMTSTPNGRNWWYDWFLMGQPNHPQYNPERLISIHADYRELNDPAVDIIIEMFRETMTKDEFAREVMAQFITDDTLFSNVEDCINTKEVEIKDGDELFIGVDIGVSNDFTVVTVMNQRYEVVEIDAFNMRESKLTHKEFKDRMMRLYYKYFNHLTAMYIEKNNQELLIEELEEDYKDSYKIFPLSMQTQTKGDVISNLRFLFDKMRIRIPDNSKLINELYGYKAKRSMLTGKLQYSNKGVDHDDHVMSLAIAAYAVLEELGSGVIQTY